MAARPRTRHLLVGVLLLVATALVCPAVSSAATAEKVVVPTVVKTVDREYATAGEAVRFSVCVTAPSNLDAFERYPLTLLDQPDAGLAIDVSSVQVSVSGKQVESGFEVVGSDGSVTVLIDDVKAFGVESNGEISISYSAVGERPGSYENCVCAFYPENPEDVATSRTKESAVSVDFADPEMPKTKSLSAIRLGNILKTGDDDITWAPAVSSVALTALLVALFAKFASKGRRG